MEAAKIKPSLIEKNTSDWPVRPNLVDYDAERAQFSWLLARRTLAGLPGGGLNIAHEAVDRHAAGVRADRTALRFLHKDGAPHAVSYAELRNLTNRFCNVLRRLGVGKGDRLFIVCGRIPELYVSMLGAFKNGTVVSPLFSAFGPDPICTRMQAGQGSVLVTTESLYRRKIEARRGSLPGLRHVLLIGEGGTATQVPGTYDWGALMAEASDDCVIERTAEEDPALLHFTSGTTGTPKGAVHVHAAAITHYATGFYALDLHDSDVFWCTADPGWVTGTSYGVIAPLLHGVTCIVDPADFDAEGWYRTLQEQKVSVWYTAPTAIRMLMKAGAERARNYSFPNLRFIASVGEPLNAEAVWWGKEVLGLPIHDNWWQTETGGIMIANTPALPIKPGSMGRPLPGVDATVMRRRNDGGVEPVAAGDEGELALRRGWPSMFRGYLGQDERYRKCFAGDWYLSGDLVKRDEDGYFWFLGRADDVIKSGGHLIGPFEVESALMAHPAVAEAGVIGKPDPTMGEVVKAFVSLHRDYEANEALRRELIGFARKKLGATVAPKEIEFQASLPHTRSGKIMRRLLKARELGLPEGDTSTLENAR
jgi:acetyl-CoA synthetase